MVTQIPKREQSPEPHPAIIALKRAQERQRGLAKEYIQWGDKVLTDSSIPTNMRIALRAIRRAQLDQQLAMYDMTRPQTNPALELALWNTQTQEQREQLIQTIQTLLKKGGR
jgi:hypothetical protein